MFLSLPSDHDSLPFGVCKSCRQAGESRLLLAWPFYRLAQGEDSDRLSLLTLSKVRVVNVALLGRGRGRGPYTHEDVEPDHPKLIHSILRLKNSGEGVGTNPTCKATLPAPLLRISVS